jgi:hypothetical protein
VATGLRFSELASITPGSFDWEAPSVRVAACYTKNGQEATLSFPDDLAADLGPFVAPLAAGAPVFPLPIDKGAAMLRVDLEAASIPYRDAAGLVFDFHALRCMLATLADQAGVSPRVVQRLMRHSSLEMTDRYTRPRAVDVDAAAKRLPSLKPEPDRPAALAATGTDSTPFAGTPVNSTHVQPLAPSCIHSPAAGGRSETLSDGTGGSGGADGNVRDARENKAQDGLVRVLTLSDAVRPGAGPGRPPAARAATDPGRSPRSAG